MDTARWKQLTDLFDAASDREPADRDAFLVAACGPDAALLHELRTLLDSGGRGGRLLEQTVRVAATTLGSDELIGELVGPWRVIRELGHGGMGTVYLAERADGGFEQRAALKLVRRGMDSAGILTRFRRERQILARLEHPNIARLLDGGLSDDGQPYFAMEYVEGEPIDRYCDRRGLSVDGRLTLFLDACRAVACAHAALVVHRDLKPANVLVTSEGQVRLLDFGIAKLLTDDDESATLTETGLHVMTPAYASPEQVRGDPVGTATDIYSLGMILYELLAGVRAYEIGSRSLSEIERVVCRQDPERPSARIAHPTGDSSGSTALPPTKRTDLRRLRKQLAGDLDVICLKALRKEPDRRYGSVEALRNDLQRHLDGLPVLARADTLGYRLRKAVRRHRVAVATTVAVAIGVAGLTAFYLVRLAGERDRARLEATKAGEVARFLQALFEVSDPALSRGDSVTARELLDRGAARIAELANQPWVQASMMQVIGDVYRVLGRRDRARPLLEGALARQRALHGDGHAEVASAQLSLGLLDQSGGDIAGADSLLRQSLATRQRLFGERDPAVVEGLNNLAFLEETKGNDPAAETLYRRALDLSRLIYPAGDHRVAYALVKLGGQLRRMGNREGAEPLLREGLAAQRAYYGNVHPDVAATVRNLAALLRDKGEYAEADTLYREALATRRVLFGDDHPEVGIVLNSYALLLQRMGDLERAVPMMREFIAQLERRGGGPHPDLAAGYSNLASMLHNDEAVTLYRRSMAVQDDVLAPGHPNRAFPRAGLASVYMEMGRPGAALPLLREALAIRRARLPAGHRYIGETLSDLGACLTALGRYEEAERLLVEADSVLLAAEGAEARRTRLARRRLSELKERMEESKGEGARE